jgi:HlyD family secretion protein
MRHLGRNVVWVLLVPAAAGGAYLAWSSMLSGGAAATYRTAPLARGDMLATIGATGSLEPEEAIDVGAQVAGQISRFGTEGGKPDGKPIDRCSQVKAGDLLAQIDPSLYKMDLQSSQAQLAQSQAQLAQSQAMLAQSEAQVVQSQANVLKAEADIQQMQAKKAQAEQDWDRAQRLKTQTPGALAETAYDGYRAAYLTAVANLASANAAKAQVEAAKTQAAAAREQALAAIEQAKATIKQTQASVDRARRNLDYCTITSPVDGVVIDRRVNIGQTVVSSLNAPSLFLIAKDLTRMQIWVSVNEADIGYIHNGQPVTFTVDARPGVTFLGEVTKVRFDATMTQNVVTYPVEVLTLNPDGLLYPYMTANVQFELGRRTDVMKAPNAALRYAPLTVDQVAPEFRAGLEKLARRGDSRETSQPATAANVPSPAGARSSEAAPAGRHEAPKGHDKGLLWVRQGEFLRPIIVRAGMTDGTTTEVESPELKEGLEVVVSEQRQSGEPPAGTSPFMPPMRRR